MHSDVTYSAPAGHSLAVLHAWERAVIIFVFVLSGFGLVGFPYAGGMTWSEVWEFTVAGMFPIVGLALPIINFVGSLLLLLRRKSSIIWLGVHIPMSIIFALVYFGVNSMNAIFLLGWCFELLVASFCLRLWSRGALK